MENILMFGLSFFEVAVNARDTCLTCGGKKNPYHPASVGCVPAEATSGWKLCPACFPEERTTTLLAECAARETAGVLASALQTKG